MDLFTSQIVSFWVWKSGRVLTCFFKANSYYKPEKNLIQILIFVCWKERYISDVSLPYEEITKIIKLIVHIEKLKSDFDKIEVLLNYKQVF